MKAFRIEGTFRMGGKDSPFTIETTGADESGARERIFSELGSRHRVERRWVKIAKVTEVPAGEIKDPAIRHRLELAKAGKGQ